MRRIKTLALAATILTMTLGAFPRNASARPRRKPYNIAPSSMSTAYIVSILWSALLP